MEITIKFNSWEELMAFQNPESVKIKSPFAEAGVSVKDITEALTAPVSEEDIQAFRAEALGSVNHDLEQDPEEMTGAKKAYEKAKAKLETPVKEELPFKPDEPTEAPTAEPEYALKDVQEAVRALVKAKGKEVAKEVLARFNATGASKVAESDYAACVAALKEANA